VQCHSFMYMLALIANQWSSSWHIPLPSTLSQPLCGRCYRNKRLRESSIKAHFCARAQLAADCSLLVKLRTVCCLESTAIKSMHMGCSNAYYLINKKGQHRSLFLRSLFRSLGSLSGRGKCLRVIWLCFSYCVPGISSRMRVKRHRRVR
jgi:hypothetical protein